MDPFANRLQSQTPNKGFGKSGFQQPPKPNRSQQGGNGGGFKGVAKSIFGAPASTSSTPGQMGMGFQQQQPQGFQQQQPQGFVQGGFPQQSQQNTGFAGGSPFQNQTSTGMNTGASTATAGGSNAKPCTNFQKTGNCKFGNNCRFSHESGAAAGGANSFHNGGMSTGGNATDIGMGMDDVASTATAGGSNAKPCTNFQKTGNCKFGNNCRFSHESGAAARVGSGGLNAKPCTNFLNGNCSFGANCRFSHSTSQQGPMSMGLGGGAPPATPGLSGYGGQQAPSPFNNAGGVGATGFPGAGASGIGMGIGMQHAGGSFASAAGPTVGFAQNTVASGGFAQNTVASGGFAQNTVAPGGFTQNTAVPGGFAQNTVASGGFAQNTVAPGGFAQNTVAPGGFSTQQQPPFQQQPMTPGAGFGNNPPFGGGGATQGFTQPQQNTGMGTGSALFPVGGGAGGFVGGSGAAAGGNNHKIEALETVNAKVDIALDIAGDADIAESATAVAESSVDAQDSSAVAGIDTESIEKIRATDAALYAVLTYSYELPTSGSGTSGETDLIQVSDLQYSAEFLNAGIFPVMA